MHNCDLLSGESILVIDIILWMMCTRAGSAVLCIIVCTPTSRYMQN
eukprot:COSAG02_NODE_1544_length_11996_cov_143.122468_5_plen_46_part_00